MILVINTADQKQVFIGLANKGKLVAKKEFQAQYKQAEKLLVEIDKLLSINNCLPRFAGEAGQLTTIKGVAVVNGPGPFTALRIGVVTANILAWALKIPVTGIKLTEFRNIDELIKLIFRKIKKAKVGTIIEPFYGKEPNITKKK